MNRNAVIIGANEEAVFSMELAHRYGLHIDALDGNAKAAGMPAADEAHHVDINDLKAVYAITDRIRPSVVLPAPIGHCLTTVGAVNDRYGLVGVSERAAVLCTDKYLFHEELTKAGLRDAEQVLLPKGSVMMDDGTEKDLVRKTLSQLTQYPVVVKPRYGSGSRGVEICGSDQELECLLRYELCADGGALTEDYVAESCIPGPEYGIDGAYAGGEFCMVLLRRKQNTPPPYRQCVGYESVLPREEPLFYERCIRLMQEVGEIVGLRNCVVHADIIRRMTDEPFVIEASARPSGHHLSDRFTPLATGVTLVEDFLKLAMPELGSEGLCAVGQLFRPRNTRKLRIRYFDLRPGRVSEVPEADTMRKKPGVLEYVCHIRPGDLLEEVRDGASVMGRGYYILEGKDKAELDRKDLEVRAGFRMEP